MKVATVKGNQVLVSIEDGDSANVGDQFFVMINGKKLGLVQIAKIKGKKAIGQIQKGRAEVGSELSLAKAGGGGGSSAHASGGSTRKRGRSSISSLYVGGLLGYNSATQSVNDATTKKTISMAGSGFSAKAFGDMSILGHLGAIGRFGIEQLSLTGSNGGVSYNTSVMYLTGDLLIRYTVLDGKYVPWVAGGMGLHFPVTKSSNALADIPTMTVFFGDVGMNYVMSPKMYITALFEYGLFPSSTDVSTSFITVRGGLAYRF